MKSYNFKLSSDEQALADMVTRHHKFRHLKDPKSVYMEAIISALEAVSK